MRDEDRHDGSAAGAAGIDPRLLELLVCPLTKSTLSYDRARAELVSAAANLAYPIRDGIPIMLVEEARVLDEGDAVPDDLRPSTDAGKG